MRLKLAFLIIGLAAGLVGGTVTQRVRSLAPPIQSAVASPMASTPTVHAQSRAQRPTQAPHVATSIRRTPSRMPIHSPTLTATLALTISHGQTARLSPTLTTVPMTNTKTVIRAEPTALVSPALTRMPATPTRATATAPPTAESSATATASSSPSRTATQTATATATETATQTATATATASATPQPVHLAITEVMTPTNGGSGTVVHATLTFVSEGVALAQITYWLPAGMRLLQTTPLAEIEPSGRVLYWRWPGGTSLLPGEAIRREVVMEVQAGTAPGIYWSQIAVQGGFPPQRVRGARFTVLEAPTATATQMPIITTTPTITPTILVTPTVTTTPTVTPTVTTTPTVTSTVAATPEVTSTVAATPTMTTSSLIPLASTRPTDLQRGRLRRLTSLCRSLAPSSDIAAAYSLRDAWSTQYRSSKAKEPQL
jgi:hypothetical protein